MIFLAASSGLFLHALLVRRGVFLDSCGSTMSSSSVDVDALGAQWNDMQIEDEEDSGMPFDGSMGNPVVEDASLCLVGKLLSERVHDFRALKNALASLWRPMKGLFAKELETNRYLFQFFHEKDLN